MNSSQIEKRGVVALNDLVLQSNVLSPEIKEGDRYPLWDGEILVYKNQKQKAGEIEGRIPLQVKSTMGRARHVVPREHLEVYLRDGGLLFFLIHLAEAPVIYIAFLLPMDIRKHLQANQKTYPLKLQPIKNVSQLEAMCHFFLANKQLQVGTDRSISLKDLSGRQSSMVLSVMPQDNFIETFTQGNFYAYADLGANGTVPCRLDDGLLALSGPANVTIAGKQYFSTSSMVRGLDGQTRFFLCDALEVRINQDKSLTVALNVGDKSSMPASLSDLFAALEFMDALLNHHKLSINGRECEVVLPKVQDGFRQNIRWAQLHRQLFQLLNIEYSHVSFKDYENNKNQIRLLDYLIATLVQGEKAILPKKPQFFIRRFRIFDQDVLIKYELERDNQYVLHNFNAHFPNEETIEIKVNSENGINSKFRISKYLLLNNTDLIRGLRGKTAQAEASLCEMFHPMAVDLYYQFVLLCIHVYDQDAIEEFLQLADRICKFLGEQENVRSLALEINRLQIVRRRRTFSSSEVRRLVQILNDSADYTDRACCCQILLEEYAVFEAAFSKMTEEQQTEFRKWPIYTLYAQWKQQNLLV